MPSFFTVLAVQSDSSETIDSVGQVDDPSQEPVAGLIELWAPFVVSAFIVVVGLRVLRNALLRDPSVSPEKLLPRQLTMLVLVLLSVVLLIITLPPDSNGIITSSLKTELLSLIGLAIAALLTLSSTTIAGNAMAGFMHRSVKAWKVGDFIRCQEHFGRVTERGLFHTEIQTEDRDLITLPNMFLANNPVRVIRSSGTIISAEVTIGYDVAHTDVQRLLERAAESAGLEDPWTWIINLGDFSVAYRVCGFHADVKTLISARSKLRAAVLDTLHRAKVEIMSPSVMNQRPLDPAAPLIPVVRAKKKSDQAESTPEDILFDKAEAAEQIEQLRSQVAAMESAVKDLEKEAKGDESLASKLEFERRKLAQARELLTWSEGAEDPDNEKEGA